MATAPKITITAILALLKEVRKGNASLGGLQEALKQLNDTEMQILADLARCKITFLTTIRDLKTLF